MRAFLRAGILSVFAILCLAAGRAEARTGGAYGLGVILGEPTGLNFKYDADTNDAFDVTLAFNLDRWILLYGDWEYKFAGAFSRSGLASVTPYVGAGVLLVSSNRSIDDTRHYQYYSDSSSSRVALGLRIPLGLEWRPPNTPIGVFVELAPGLTIVPGTYMFAQGGIGIRFFF